MENHNAAQKIERRLGFNINMPSNDWDEEIAIPQGG
jgi:hypothetical protein